MKTKGILIVLFFTCVAASCSTDNSASKLTPISRWALGVMKRVHPPAWQPPSDSLRRIEEHWAAVVREDKGIAWQYANRPDEIEDSTVIELSGDYVPSDSLPELIKYHCARLDTAINAQENYMIDYSRLYSSDPAAWINKPIAAHSADSLAADISALKVALLLHREVVAIRRAEGRSITF